MDCINDPNIHHAAFYGDLRELKLALDKGQDPERADVTGMNALHKAAAGGHIPFLNALLEKGCSVNQQDNNGCTTVHHAARNGHLETVRWLVEEKGADVTVKTKKGKTAYTSTKMWGSATYVRQQEILSFLKSKEIGENPWEKPAK